jgi:3-dehydroquinate synthetase
VRQHFERVGLKTRLDTLDPDRLMARMRKDKKVKDGRISLILVRDIGQAFISREVADADLRAFLSQETKTLASAARAH